MSRRLIAAAVAAGLVLAAGTSAAEAQWLSRIAASVERAGVKGAAKGALALESAIAQLKAIPAGKGAALAAHVSDEGHWTFVNRAGERFTAGTPDEMKRALGVLAPEAAAKDARVTVVLTEDTVFGQPGLLKDLPRDVDLMIAFESEAYPLVRRGTAVNPRLYAEVRPNLLVELDSRARFDEAAWQLARPLERARLRVLALEPGGPATFAMTPKLDSQTKRALVDSIDPDKLANALYSIRGQMAVVTGRIEGEKLAYRAASGAESSLAMKDLAAAAEAADVNLVILNSPTPRQPGVRNWLWLRAEVDGLERAAERAHLSDFLNTLGGEKSRFVVSTADAGPGRVSFRAVPIEEDRAPLPNIGNIVSEVASEVAGKVVTEGVQASLRSAERQRELDGRIVPGIPSAIQYLYIGSLILGLAGLPFARAWWARLWPAERREGYGNASGYQAARVVRLALFGLVFMPAVSLASAPLAMLHSSWQSLKGMALLLGWPLRWLASRKT